MLNTPPQPAPQVSRQQVSRFLVLSLGVAGLVIAGGTWGWLQRDTSSQAVLPTATVPSVTVAALADAITQGERMLMLDLRSQTEFLASHVPDAVSMPSYDVLRSSERLTPFAGWPTVLMCGNVGCSEVTQAVRDLRLLGFQDLRQLEGGFAAYKAANLTLASQAKLVQDDLASVLKSVEVPTISVDQLIASKADVTLVDTRTPYEFATGFIEGAIDLPLYATQAAIEAGRYAKSAVIVVYDREGNRSRIVARALLDAGFENVRSLEGGLEAWVAADGAVGFPKEDGSDLPVLVPLLDADISGSQPD